MRTVTRGVVLHRGQTGYRGHVIRHILILIHTYRYTHTYICMDVCIGQEPLINEAECQGKGENRETGRGDFDEKLQSKTK